MPDSPARTLLELRIRERCMTLEEFVEYIDRFGRDHGEAGTLSPRHLQRLIAGRRLSSSLRPATARLLERIFGETADALLEPPRNPSHLDSGSEALPNHASTKPTVSVPRRGNTHKVLPDLDVACEWLDHYTGRAPGTGRQMVKSRIEGLDFQLLRDRNSRRAAVGRSEIAQALSDYYGNHEPRYGSYRATYDGQEIATSIMGQSGWLDLECQLPNSEHVTLAGGAANGFGAPDDIVEALAVQRLAEASALNVRIANAPIYRLLDVKVRKNTLVSTVGLVPFVRYALTMDMLEGELVDAIAENRLTRPGALPLHDTYLPSLETVLDL